MKRWKKIAIAVGSAAVVGVATFVVNEEIREERWEHELYATAIQQAANTNTTSMNVDELFYDIDGKVTAVTDSQITIDIPLQGTQTYAINQQTKIEDVFFPLKKGALVDLDASGDLAFHIETQRTMDSYGTIIEITDQQVTIDANGTRQTFTKASHFRIDAEGYKGELNKLPAEITLNANLEIVGLEIDFDVEGGDD